MKIIVLSILFFVELLSYNRASTYEEVFSYLEEKGVIVGRDINHDELFNLLQNDGIYLENGQIDLDKLSPYLNPYLHGADITNLKANTEEEIVEKYKLDKTRPVDKEMLHYIKNHESQVQKEALEKYAGKNKEEEPLDESMVEEEKTENKGWFQSTIDNFLEKIKF